MINLRAKSSVASSGSNYLLRFAEQARTSGSHPRRLLPRLNAKLLSQIRKLPPGAHVISVAHRMADIKPDERESLTLIA
jgi:hypothetical protein